MPPLWLRGTSIKAPARFAAFANGVFIHADDFDDTQLSAEISFLLEATFGLMGRSPDFVGGPRDLGRTVEPSFSVCQRADNALDDSRKSASWGRHGWRG